MNSKWNQNKIKRYIDQKESEGLSLEYKGAEALGTNNKERDEITKDISAMANSAGGIVIFGIAKHPDKNLKHLPGSIDPIDKSKFSIEWLGQKIDLIQPRIQDIKIHSVPINTHLNHVVYVVEIPKSTTAHQATDLLYYKRFDTRSVPMYNHEILDVMSRGKHPKIEPEFEIVIMEQYRDDDNNVAVYRSDFPNLGLAPLEKKKYTTVQLRIKAVNSGAVYAQYINAFLEIPERILRLQSRDSGAGETTYNKENHPYNSTKYRPIQKDNTIRDVVDTERTGYYSVPKYGPARYDPILPNLSWTWTIPLSSFFEVIEIEGFSVKWEIYADNAPMRSGDILIKDIPVTKSTRRTV